MIYTTKPRNLARQASLHTVSWLNAFGTFAGLISANIWDFVAGGVIIAGVFGAPILIGGMAISELVFGALISLGLWWIQLLLWKHVLSGGITVKDIPAIILGVVIAIADTNLDTAAAFLWIAKGGPIIRSLLNYTVFDINVGKLVIESLTVALYVLGGFTELFNALYLRSKSASTYKPKPVTAAPKWSQSTPAPSYYKPTTNHSHPIPNSTVEPQRKTTSLADLIKNNPKVSK